MTPTDFLQALESVLRHRREPFSHEAAVAFVEIFWEQIADDPDEDFWASRFLESRKQLESCLDNSLSGVAEIPT